MGVSSILKIDSIYLSICKSEKLIVNLPTNVVSFTASVMIFKFASTIFTLFSASIADF